MAIMKAITIWQPWASLIVLGIKDFETRTWYTPQRGITAIHAAKTKIEEEDLHRCFTPEQYDYIMGKLCGFYGSYDNLPLGAVIGTAFLSQVYRTDTIREKINARERASGDFTPGRYAWRMESPIIFKEPIPCSGKQGFWNWERGVSR